MSEKKVNNFSFDLNSTNELTEEIYNFPDETNKRKKITFISSVVLIAMLTMYLSYQFGVLLNIDTLALSELYADLKKTDIQYTQESATNTTLTSEKESLTQELLKKQSETGQLSDYTINKDTLEKKLNEVKNEYEKLKATVDEKKKQISENGETVYTLTLNPGVYVVGQNIPPATFDVTGNGSILAASLNNETKINEKLSKDTPITLHFEEDYTVKITSITKFVLKE